MKTADGNSVAAGFSAELALTGPSHPARPGHSPVRGDLAHIRLAGQHFVPHYAVPMPHRAGPDGATLRKAGRADAETAQTLKPGELFSVLDIAGGWAWGQADDEGRGEDGPVGYISLDQLEPLAP